MNDSTVRPDFGAVFYPEDQPWLKKEVGGKYRTVFVVRHRVLGIVGYLALMQAGPDANVLVGWDEKLPQHALRDMQARNGTCCPYFPRLTEPR